MSREERADLWDLNYLLPSYVVLIELGLLPVIIRSGGIESTIYWAIGLKFGLSKMLAICGIELGFEQKGWLPLVLSRDFI